ALAQDFAHLVRQRQPTQLDPWLQRATTSALEAVRRFAAGLAEDSAAVTAGGPLPRGPSPVEGHINRPQKVETQKWGRAHLDLLSRRFLLAPRGPQAQAPGQRTPTPAHAAAA